MLKGIGIVLIVIGAILIWNIPLLGWAFGGLLVFIGISVILMGYGIPWFRKGMNTFKTVVPSSVKVCPDCKAPIAGDAKVCMHCGYRYSGAVADPQTFSGSSNGIDATSTAWPHTHRVPDAGMAAWTAPDPKLPPAVTLNGRLELVVAERAGDWARVAAVNGWTGWVDGRLLVPTFRGLD
jgi:Uncharacterised protein family UPF0547